MALHWVTGFDTTVQSSIGIVNVAQSIYSNGRTVTGQLTLVQKAVVVATHLMCVTDSVDMCRARLAVVEESITPTVSVPEDEDKDIKGLYPFAQGPVFFSPRRKIEIPSESELFLVIEKLSGSISTIINVHWRFLLYTSLA